jgi:hypothetical protein
MSNASIRRANRLGMYADLQPILDAALAAGGGSYTLENYGQAVHWRQRAYRFRKLYAETVSMVSKYDQLTLPRIEEGSSTVHIRMNVPKGTFAAAQVAPVFEPFDDDLESEAEAFAKRLAGGM